MGYLWVQYNLWKSTKLGIIFNFVEPKIYARMDITKKERLHEYL